MYISTKNYCCTHQQLNCFVFTTFNNVEFDLKSIPHIKIKSNFKGKNSLQMCTACQTIILIKRVTHSFPRQLCEQKLFFFYNKLKLLLTCTSVRSVFNILHSPKLMHAPVTEGAAYPWQAGAGASCCIATFES